MRTSIKGSTPGLIARLNPFRPRKDFASPREECKKIVEQKKSSSDDTNTSSPSPHIFPGNEPRPVLAHDNTPHSRHSSSDSEDEITYPEGGLRAWLVTFGSFCAMFAGFGILNTIGAFQAHLAENQLKNYSDSSISWIFSIYVFLVFFCGLQIGPIFDAKGPTLLVISGSILLVLSIMLLGLCTEYWHFILDFSIIAGVGSSLLFTPAIAAISHFFMKGRGTATGLAATGGSFGGIIFPLMLQALFPKVGWAWATRILGFLLLFLCCIGILLCRSRLPPKKGANTTWRDMLPDLRIFLDGSGAFAATTAGVFFLEWGLFVPITYLTSYARAQGLGEDFSFQLIAILNAGSCFGRFLPGYFADRAGRFNIMIVTTAMCLVSVFCFWLPDSLGTVPGSAASKALLVTYAVVFGFASGSNISLTPICVGQLCETQEYGRYYATSYTIVSFGSLTGIPIAGALISATGEDAGKGYWGVVVFTGLCYAAALACFTWVRVRMVGAGWRTVW